MLVMANWKMHGNRAQVAAWAHAIRQTTMTDGVTAVACPPFPFLLPMRDALMGSDVLLGGQDVDAHDQGAYTGQVAAPMLLDVGCSYVIVGHSERRAMYGDDDMSVRAKVIAARQHGLTVVVCVGEDAATRTAGNAEQHVAAQLQSALADLPLTGIVIAYEPIWAIGSGCAATPDDVHAMHAAIRKMLATMAKRGKNADNIAILYGGSVNRDNAAALFAVDGVNGALVGGASLDAAHFADICRAAVN